MLKTLLLLTGVFAKLPLRLQTTTMPVPVIPLRQNLNNLVLHGLQGRGLDQAVLVLEAALAQSVASVQNSLKQPQGILLTPITPREGDATTFADVLTDQWSSIVKETVDMPRLGPLNPASWTGDEVASFLSPVANAIPHHSTSDVNVYEADVPGIGHLVMTDTWQPHKLKPVGIELPVVGPMLPLARFADVAPPIQLPFKLLPKSKSWLPNASSVVKPIEQIEDGGGTDAPAAKQTDPVELPIIADADRGAPVRRLGEAFSGVPIAFRKLGVLDDWRILEKPFFRKVLHYLPRASRTESEEDDLEVPDTAAAADYANAIVQAAAPPPFVPLLDPPDDISLVEGKRFLVQRPSWQQEQDTPILEF